MSLAAVASQDIFSQAGAPTPHYNAAHEEHQYLSLIRKILAKGEHRKLEGVATPTRSIFAPPQLRFSLSKPGATPDADPIPILPIVTTKRVFLRAVISEILWFISGGTSCLPLSEAGIRIWDTNGSREFLDKVGLGHREVGDLGPVYGFQWRHFGAEYVNAKKDYTGQGVDQLAEVVRKLKEAPFDIRIILSAWNPADLMKMASRPCHTLAQFYVSYPNGLEEKGSLSCQLYQATCDMALGWPFNISSYALLTHILAHATDLHPGSLIHTMGDAHVYLNHVDALNEQLTREPTEFPKLRIKRGDRGSGVVDGWKEDDFDVIGYQPHKAIKMIRSV
jgi:thymidylate synthase